jgi:hypothetical protein
VVVGKVKPDVAPDSMLVIRTRDIQNARAEFVRCVLQMVGREDGSFHSIVRQASSYEELVAHVPQDIEIDLEDRRVWRDVC